MKKITLHILLLAAFCTIQSVQAQLLQLPTSNTNYRCKTGRVIGVTDIDINWNAPGVKGREGKIWGTSIAHYGFMVLGFGSNVPSPWRAGADENTTIAFSTDVMINGKKLAAGKYGFHIALYADSCTLIFNKNTNGWGSYFYNSSLDVLRIKTIQQKDIKESKERLDYTFTKQTDHSVEVALEWEHWRIPFTAEVDLTGTTLNSIRTQLSGAMGFDPPSLEAGANWCLQNKINYEEALGWINTAVDPSLGGVNTFRIMSTKAGLLEALNRKEEADKIMQAAVETANATELHTYARQLLTQNKVKEAMVLFEKNYKKNNGAWPTPAGLMRAYSASGDLKKALEYAKKALPLAPNPGVKKIIEEAIVTLESGKPL